MKTGQMYAVIVFLTTLFVAGCGVRSQDPADVRGRLATPETAELSDESVRLLDVFASLNPKPLETLTAAEARRQPSIADAVTAMLKQQNKSTEPVAVGSVAPITIPGPEGGIPARVYTPRGSGPFPVLVYFHGGGWVIADLDTYDASARALTNASERVVVSVHYRQAPESKFPAAVQDAFAAYRWVLSNAQSINGDPDHVAIAGESAGGNLAAATTIFAKEQGIPQPEHQVLIYPITNFAFDTPSYVKNANAKPLNREMMRWFWGNYLTTEAEGVNPYASPLRANNLTGVAPATIITAEVDPLQSEAIDYADRLREAGVPVRYRNFEGVTHEFFGAGAVIPQARDAVQFAADGLRGARR